MPRTSWPRLYWPSGTGSPFWDALIVHSAEVLGASLLRSEDLNPGQRFGSLEVRNPFQEN